MNPQIGLKNSLKVIAITGGSGFIGTALVEGLKARGYKNITNIDRSQDIDMQDTDKLMRLIKKGCVVVHLAWSGTPKTPETDAKSRIDNIEGSLNLLEASRLKGVDKLIYVSSGGTVYGNKTKIPSKEMDPTNPKCSYGIQKLLVEKYVELYGYLYGMKSVIVRLANPYGKKNMAGILHGAVDVFLKKITEGNNIKVEGAASTTRDYIHIKDTVNFIIKAIESKNMLGVYNIGTGRGTSIRDLLKKIQKITKRNVSMSYGPSSKSDLEYNVLDISKAKKTGWEPKYSLEKGIAEIYSLSYEKK